MAIPPDQLKAAGARLETPFLIRQVETHLVFGPLSRHFPTVYLFVVMLGLLLVIAFTNTAGPLHGMKVQLPLMLPGLLCGLAVFPIFRKYTLRQQAIIGWIAIKGALGFGALMILLVGATASFVRLPDAWPNLFLGLIWIPGLEFVPKITPHQVCLSVMRLILTLPCVYFGVRSGNWHW